MVADVCNVAVLMYRQEEGAAFGAAMQALEIVSDSGLSELLQEHLYEDLERCCVPGGEAAGFYDDAFQEYQRAAEQVAGYYGN